MTRSSSGPGRTLPLVLFLQPFSRVYLARQQRNHSCFMCSPRRGPALITYPSKGTKCHCEITLKIFTRQSIPVKRKMNGNSIQSPLSPMFKMAGHMTLHHLNERHCLVIVFSNKSFLFYYPALLTVHSFLMDGFIFCPKGLRNNGSHQHCYKLQLVCLQYIYVYMVMLLYLWVFTRTVQAVNRHRLYANERFR